MVQSQPLTSLPPNPIHHAFNMPNITNFIKITLNIRKGQCNTWSEIFKIHARTNQVLDIAPADPLFKYNDLEL